MTCVFYYELPIGRVGIAEDGQGVTHIFLAGQSPLINAFETETPQIKQTADQLAEYFQGRRKEFQLRLNPHGTEFQKKVWAALRDIPYGTTRTYKEIAAQIGQPNASRAVGHANSKNPLPFCVPCHRVVSADGGLGGYALGLELKQRLLELEQTYN